MFNVESRRIILMFLSFLLLHKELLLPNFIYLLQSLHFVVLFLFHTVNDLFLFLFLFLELFSHFLGIFLHSLLVGFFGVKETIKFLFFTRHFFHQLGVEICERG